MNGTSDQSGDPKPVIEPGSGAEEHVEFQTRSRF
jgi:hypothetical protein